MNIKDFVKDQFVEFDFYRDDTFYYVCTDGVDKYRFAVPIKDIGDGCLLSKDKALYFMRYIRKAMDNNELQKLS